MKPLTTAENVTIFGFKSGASKRIKAPLLPICNMQIIHHCERLILAKLEINIPMIINKKQNTAPTSLLMGILNSRRTFQAFIV